ncbi:hypothetical protein FBZ98_104548 [Rhizobium sp. ERR 922]|uniref:Eco29kI family restriction endonuclease n=2 Tax=Rhizobium TaxID=379 RepID=UPI0011A2080C|nr:MULTISPECIES: hypothetical protein [unclassified Rhizobium]TWB53621.1 hypothetical protein FBZ98_104548 [Rhizobium sp. ERR 922]TWB95415.1 hypothetical protein FBZ97_104103 [Rhizobium sp. ERR 942]
MDIARDGILLYETPGLPRAKPKPQDPEVVEAEMIRHFGHWFPSATHRFELAKEAMGRGYGKEAAFDLHQTVATQYRSPWDVLHPGRAFATKLAASPLTDAALQKRVSDYL